MQNYEDADRHVIRRGPLKKDLKIDDKLLCKGAEVTLVSYMVSTIMDEHKIMGGTVRHKVPMLRGTFLEYQIDGYLALHIPVRDLPEHEDQYV